jgi:cell division protein FtsZ
LLEVSAEGAKGVLFTISGKDDLSMWEVQEAAKIVTENVDKEAKIIFGAVNDERLKAGQVKVTVIASGFPGGFARNVNLFSPEAQVLKAEGEIEATSETQEEETQESQWSSIPAFLRRSKKI